jgi:hypothetical protein
MELNHIKSDPESIAAHLRFAAEILIAATIIVCSLNDLPHLCLGCQYKRKLLDLCQWLTVA